MLVILKDGIRIFYHLRKCLFHNGKKYNKVERWGTVNLKKNFPITRMPALLYLYTILMRIYTLRSQRTENLHKQLMVLFRSLMDFDRSKTKTKSLLTILIILNIISLNILVFHLNKWGIPSGRMAFTPLSNGSRISADNNLNPPTPRGPGDS